MRVSHDRDGLHDLWPSLYSADESCDAPGRRAGSHRDDARRLRMAVLLLRLSQGRARARAGVRRQQAAGAARCDRLIQPLVAFPAHWSPMSMLFYTGTMFPVAYRTGAFIAFHGSAFRAPLPQEGYHIVFLQFNDGMAGDYHVFATGFAGGMTSPEGAAHRAVGLAQGPDGALYVSDDKGGRIWRITYKAK